MKNTITRFAKPPPSWALEERDKGQENGLNRAVPKAPIKKERRLHPRRVGARLAGGKFMALPVKKQNGFDTEAPPIPPALQGVLEGMLQRVQRGESGPFLRTNGQPREFIGVVPGIAPPLLSVKKTGFPVVCSRVGSRMRPLGRVDGMLSPV